MTREEKKKEKLEEEKQFIESIKGKYLTGDLKKKFRETMFWKNFRGEFYIVDIKILKNGKKKFIIGVDYLTRNKLTKRFNLHHKKLDSRFYTELIKKYYVPLNPQSHECVHWFYTQCIKDPTFEKRFLDLIHEMLELNNFKDVKDFK